MFSSLWLCNSEPFYWYCLFPHSCLIITFSCLCIISERFTQWLAKHFSFEILVLWSQLLNTWLLVKSLNSRTGIILSFAAAAEKSRFQNQRWARSGCNLSSSICTTYFPSIGKNFQAWKDPPVAMKKFLQYGWALIMKSWSGVIASLDRMESMKKEKKNN